MLLFNCTKDACAALTAKRNGVATSLVNDQPLPETDTPWVWQLHAVKIMRQSVLVAMHVDTRFAMMFWGIVRTHRKLPSFQGLVRIENYPGCSIPLLNFSAGEWSDHHERTGHCSQAVLPGWPIAI